MKKSILISLLVGMMGVIAFIGCERETISPNEGQPQRANEDSLINQQGDTLSDKITVEHWKAVRIGYYNYHDGTYYHNETYTYAYMDIYPQDSILYATDVDTLDGYHIISNGVYSSYSMNGDTITVYFPTEMEIAECQRKWMVYRTNDTTMNWQYLGGGIPENNNSYKFYLIGVE